MKGMESKKSLPGNFHFLDTQNWSLVARTAEQAENYLFTDPNTSLFKLRQFLEHLCTRIFLEEGIPMPAKLIARIQEIRSRELLSEQVIDLMHDLRKSGNEAVHEYIGTVAQAQPEF